MRDKNKCVTETKGRVVALYMPAEEPAVIAVEYTVNGKLHTVEERLRYRTTALWGDQFGPRSITKMKEICLGTETPVMYDPWDPKNAYIKENMR